MRTLARQRRDGWILWNYLAVGVAFVYVGLVVGPCGSVVTAAAASDWAPGDWRVRVRTNQMDALFPRREWTRTSSLGDDDVQSPKRERGRHTWFSGVRRRQTYESSLVLFGNGTFCMLPPAVHSSACLLDDDKERLPIHGHWEAAPNPYCATDCSTQAVVLTSYPRQLQAVAAARLEDREGQRHALVWHGRLAGRYARPRPRGRLTHGKVVRQDLSSSLGVASRRPPILASFEAVQEVPP
jgi:hypothetical protein